MEWIWAAEWIQAMERNQAVEWIGWNQAVEWIRAVEWIQPVEVETGSEIGSARGSGPKSLRTSPQRARVDPDSGVELIS